VLLHLPVAGLFVIPFLLQRRPPSGLELT